MNHCPTHAKKQRLPSIHGEPTTSDREARSFAVSQIGKRPHSLWSEARRPRQKNNKITAPTMLRAAGLALLLPLCVQAECGEPFDECADNTTCFQLTPYADKPYVFDCAFINATKTPTRGYGRGVNQGGQRRRRGDVDPSEETSRGDTAAAAWTYQRRRASPP